MAGSIDFKGKIDAVDAADNLMVFKGEPSNPTEAGNYTVKQLLDYLDTLLDGTVSKYLSDIAAQKDAAVTAASEAQASASSASDAMAAAKSSETNAAISSSSASASASRASEHATASAQSASDAAEIESKVVTPTAMVDDETYTLTLRQEHGVPNLYITKV